MIDSDPDANIADVIGEEVKFCDTIGGKMKDLKDKIQKRKLPLDVPKNQVIEGDVYNCLIVTAYLFNITSSFNICQDIIFFYENKYLKKKNPNFSPIIL